MSDYRIERINEDRLKDLLQLYKASFGKTYPIRYLQNKFNTQYTGISFVGYLAYDQENQAAAYYGVFPCYINYNGRQVLSAQSGDTMTHPAHQGKGLFTRLARLTYDLAKELKVQFIFGFPNANSYPGFIKKLNWKDKGAMEQYTIQVPTIPVSSLLQFFRIKHIYIHIISKYLFNKGTTLFSYSSIQDEGFGGIDRSIEYLGYKKYEGNFTANIQNKKVWLKIDHRLIIGDLEPMSSNDFQDVVNIIRRKAILAGIRRIIFITSPGTYYSAEFKKISGIHLGETIHDCYLDEYDDSIINPANIKFTGADWDSF